MAEIDEKQILSAFQAIKCRKYRGLDHQTLLDEMFLAHDLEQDQVDDIINVMLDRGIIYEPLLGHYKAA